MVFPVIGGDGKPTGYDIDNSLRFDGNNDYLTHTRGTATNEKKFTFSTWVKLGNTGHGANGTLFGSGDDGNGYAGDMLAIQTNGLIKQGDHDGSTDNHNVRTNAVLRDPSAWYHIVCAADSTQGTASNRIKLYINGTQQTGLAASTYPSQDITFDCNTNGQVLNIGRNQNGENHVYFDGYMAETVFIDGQQLTPSSFGETDDNGVWIPKDISAEGLTFGNNGFYLEYKQSGDSANSSGKGADTSGEDTHFAANNMSGVEAVVDTPTNNFATLNPLQTITYPTLSEGNVVQTGHSSSDSAGIGATIMPASGKWYAEAKVPNISSASDGYPHFGITDTSLLSTRGTQGTKIAAGFKINDAASVTNTNILGTTTLTNTNWPSWSDDDIINFALDLDNRKLYIGKNGTYINSGNPAAGSNHQITWANSTEISLILAGYSVSSGSGGGGDDTSWNYGNPAFSISSGNADANGYGNFEYAPPSGYYAICTKNLAEYG